MITGRCQSHPGNFATAIGAVVVALSSMLPVTAGAAAEWVSIAKSDRTEVFADPASVGRSPSAPWVIVITKQNFMEPQPSAKKGKVYLSAKNEYRVDCENRRLAYRELQTFAELDLLGASVQKTKIGEKNLKWMDAASGTVFGEILDYACKNAAGSQPPMN
jgi:signal recognition particle receptor subunit beta